MRKRVSAKYPIRPRPWVWPWFLLGTVIIIGAMPFLPGELNWTTVVLAGVSGLWGVVFFVHKSHAEDARFMKELFEYFNRRYDEQNNDLQSMLEKDGDFDESRKLAFVDYFNLCAEESVFRDAGYIYDPVWESWENGMKQFSKDPRVAELWDEERTTNSYYGFNLPLG